jgi:hypothetical protein
VQEYEVAKNSMPSKSWLESLVARSVKAQGLG